MKKKIMSMLLVCVMAIGLLSGCGSQQAETSEQPVASEEEATEEAVETEEVYQLFPVNSNPLSDVRVRQAIAYAIDMEEIAETFFKGQVTPANSMVPANGVEELNNYSYDPEKAMELLEDAGWDENYVLKVVYTYTDQETVDFMAVIQSYLAAVGIQMEASLIEGDVNTQLWTPPADMVNGPSAVDWDIYYGAVAAPNRLTFYDGYKSSSMSSHTPTSEDLAAVADKLQSTANPEEQAAYLEEIQILCNEQLPVLPLYHMDVYSIESDAVNRNGAPYGNEQYKYDWQIEKWDIEPNEDGKKVLRTNTGPIEFFYDVYTTNNGNAANKVLFDTLIVANSDLTEFAPQAAESFEISEDDLSVSFVLKDGLKWHDGSDVTIDDVKFTWELACKVSTISSIYGAVIPNLEGFEAFVNGETEELAGIVVEGNKITFKFASIAPTMMFAFSQLPILPKAYLEDADPTVIQQNSFWQSPIGSGPFKVKEVSMNNYCVLEAFDEYHKGRPVIDEIYMYPSTETDASLVKNVSAGLYDYAWSKSLADVQACSEVEGYTTSAYPMLYTRQLIINKFEHAE